MKRQSKRAWVLIGILAIAGVMAAVGAYAYWTTTGTGAGSATTGTTQNFIVTQQGSPVTGLVPGGTAQSFTVRVNNPASFSQYLSTLTVSVANSDGTAWTSVPGCSAADFDITQPSVTAGDLTPGNHDYSASIAMLNTASNQNACKSVTVPLYFSAT